MPDNVVEFVVAEFRGEYPFFSELTDTQLSSLFRKACLRLRNDAKSCVKAIEVRKEFLYLIVAHLATLFQKALAGNGLVGCYGESVGAAGRGDAHVPIPQLAGDHRLELAGGVIDGPELHVFRESCGVPGRGGGQVDQLCHGGL